MKKVKFQSYLEFYDFISPEHQLMVTFLKDIIKETIPDIKEKLSWNVPFFYKKKSICFIWPGSAPWGDKTNKDVQLGFTKGYLLRSNSYLEIGNRKQVRIKTFNSLTEIEEDLEIIIELLREAVALDK